VKSARAAMFTWIGPRNVYGRPLATKTNAARSRPSIVSCGSRRPRDSARIRRIAATKAPLPGRRPSAARPRSSTLRTASASRPIPDEKQKRLPLTTPRLTERVRPVASAPAMRAAARSGSRGRPSARGKTLAPPPGRKPKGTRPAAPLIASL
jgi:hypothetical protein